MCLLRGTEHVSEKKMLVSGGTVVVALRDSIMEDRRREYMIDPRSVAVV